MLYFFFKYFSSEINAFNVFKYITFRTGLSVATSLAFILLVGESLIMVKNISFLKEKIFNLLENNDILLVKSSNRIGLFNFFKKF